MADLKKIWLALIFFRKKKRLYERDKANPQNGLTLKN